MRLLTDPFAAGYMQRALVGALILAVLGGAVGVLVQLRRLAFMTDALTHAVFPGVAIAVATGTSLAVGALVAAVIAVVVLTLADRSGLLDADSWLALVLASFFAVGVVVVSRGRSYTADITSLLFGRLLTLSDRDLVEMAVVGVLVLVVLAALRKELLLRAFDPEGAAAVGYPVARIDLVANLAVALVMVAAIKAVGTALVVALLITPAATARLLTDRLVPLIAVSCLVPAVAGWLGLGISYEASIHHDVSLAPGATIVVVLTALFAVVAVGTSLRRHVARRRSEPVTA